MDIDFFVETAICFIDLVQYILETELMLCLVVGLAFMWCVGFIKYVIS